MDGATNFFQDMLYYVKVCRFFGVLFSPRRLDGGGAIRWCDSLDKKEAVSVVGARGGQEIGRVRAVTS